MNKKELIKLLDKYKIEYEITDNTKEVEEGLRLLDEALEKIGIIIPKETQVDTITTENDTEVPKHTTEWANSDDLISRRTAIEAMAPFDTNHELRDTLESLPPVEPPKKVIAQIKVDTEEIVERIKEEYEITDRPVCEDAISRQAAIDVIMSEPMNEPRYPSWWADKINSLPPAEPKPTDGDLISRRALIKEIMEDGNGAVLSYTKGMDEDELVERIERQMIEHFIGVVNYMPPVESKAVSSDLICRIDTVNALCRECGLENKCGGADCHENWCTEVKVIMGMPSVESKSVSGDLILRQDAIDALMGHFIPQTYTEEQVKRADKLAKRIINAIPSVGQTERPKGEWIESYLNEWCGTDENHNSVFRKIPCVKCDQCGEKRRGKENFCPNCGADMRGEK